MNLISFIYQGVVFHSACGFPFARREIVFSENFQESEISKVAPVALLRTELEACRDFGKEAFLRLRA